MARLHDLISHSGPGPVQWHLFLESLPLQAEKNSSPQSLCFSLQVSKESQPHQGLAPLRILFTNYFDTT